MEGLKRRLSFRKKKKDVKVPECSKPHQWQEDEKKVREGSCSFQVRVGKRYNQKMCLPVLEGVCNISSEVFMQKSWSSSLHIAANNM